MKSEVVETRACKMWLDEDHITHEVFKNDVEITADDVVEMLETRKKLIKGRKGPILADIRGIKSVTKGARDFGNDEEGIRITTAFGIVIGSPLSSTIGNIFIMVTNPPYPTRLFTSYERAIEWLKGFIE